MKTEEQFLTRLKSKFSFAAGKLFEQLAVIIYTGANVGVIIFVEKEIIPRSYLAAGKNTTLLWLLFIPR